MTRVYCNPGCLDGNRGFEPSREALRMYWLNVANALLCLRMRKTHTAITLNQNWARTANIFPCFSLDPPAPVGRALGFESGAAARMSSRSHVLFHGSGRIS
jgi:hypothetical protein